MSGSLAAVVVGPDPDDLGHALEDQGVAVAYASGTGARSALEAAGIADADLLVVTDVGLSTCIPVATELAPDLRIVVYSRDSIPEFARPQADLIVDPDLVGPDAMAEELARD
ncbi:MAG: CTP synthetase [Haloarculaceae archaeon]